MNLQELKVTREALKKSLREYESITPCCHSCLNYERNHCSVYKAAPPPEWVNQPVDCPEWSHDGVPF
jgi:hypothetical protein